MISTMRCILLKECKYLRSTEACVYDGMQFYNTWIESNEEQRRAVENIVGGKYIPAPYIVFGPPGM
jgi:hypothetical protein